MNNYEWQPIESAPKDGTEILLLKEIQWTFGDTKDSRIGKGNWIGAYWFEEKTEIWRSRCDTWLDDPTHWMPLPDGPKR